MTNIPLLENPLIRRYFGCKESGLCVKDWHEKGESDHSHHHMAYRILRAMSEPVKEGELYLAISEYGNVKGPQAFTFSDHWKFHCQWLRLPDAFQTKKECVTNCGPECSCPCRKPDPVERFCSQCGKAQ